MSCASPAQCCCCDPTAICQGMSAPHCNEAFQPHLCWGEMGRRGLMCAFCLCHWLIPHRLQHQVFSSDMCSIISPTCGGRGSTGHLQALLGTLCDICKKPTNCINLCLRLSGVWVLFSEFFLNFFLTFWVFFMPLFSHCLSGVPGLGPSSVADLGLPDNEIFFLSNELFF